LTPDQTAPADQFHTGGIVSTRALAQLGDFQPDWSVLDVGGGLGGPARTLAQDAGCRVTVLDLTPEYCEVGAWLTERTGQGDRVTHQVGDALALPFEDGAFDAVWTQHSSMNVDDKEQLYSEIQRVLRPGGRFVFHEIMAGPNQPIHFPVPWAPAQAISFLREPETVRALLASQGFEEVTWRDTSASAAAWFRERVTAMQGMSTPPPLGLHLLLGPRVGTMLGNVLRNLDEGRLAIIQAVLTRTYSGRAPDLTGVSRGRPQGSVG